MEGTMVFVEFDQDGTPMQVLTHESHLHGVTCHDYGFENSKKYGLLYHYLGMGPADSVLKPSQGFMVNESGEEIPTEVVYWAAYGIQVSEPPLCKRLETLPELYAIDTLFDGFTALNCEQGIIWCSVCDDYMPDDEPDYCEHVWWCRICDDISTPDERCGHEEGAEEE